MRWFTGIIINAILFIAISGFFKESFYIEGFWAALGASFVLAVINILVKPFIILLTLPVTVLTLGLFLFVINGITLMITDEIVGSSFEIDGFWMAVLISLIMSIGNIIIQNVLFDSKKEK